MFCKVNRLAVITLQGTIALQPPPSIETGRRAAYVPR